MLSRVPDQARPDRQRGRPGHAGVSAVALLRAMADGRLRPSGQGRAGFPGVAEQDGNALIHALIDAGGQDPDWLTEEKLAGNPVRISAATYARWFDTLPDDFRKGVEAHWGPAPGELYVDGTDIVVAALRSGNVVLIVQPPRGFGENPVAIYHDPDLPPSHHYLGAYRWLAAPQSEGGFGARRDRAPRQARQPRVAARQDAGDERLVRDRRGARRPAAGLPVPGQRPGGGHAGQAPRARHARRPPHPADGPGRDLRRHRAARAAARRARERRGARPGQAAGDPRSRSGR